MTVPILPDPPRVTRLEPGQITPGLTQALRAGAVLAPAQVAVLALVGPGAVGCFQGLLTNDVEKAGDGAFVYGALLTPKGMIVVDGWAARQGAEVAFTVPAIGRERAAAIFQKSVPPRLAHLEDRTTETVVLRLAGTRALAIAEAARLPLPSAPGRVLHAALGSSPPAPPGAEAVADIARASEGAPYVLQLTASPPLAERLRERLVSAGAEWTEPAGLEFTRILAGWPGLASEVDEKTIPQEVRFDVIGGVSYTKGCYTGQETVSRLHFRGHANRQLRGLAFEQPPAQGDALPVVHAERDVGRVTSVTWLPEGAMGGPVVGRWIGLGVIRHEVEPGTLVRAAGVEARVMDLPFTLPRIEPA